MKTRIALLILSIVLCGAGTSMSHEPSYIRLSFDPGSKNLRITVAHEAGDSPGHFVHRISVVVDHEEVDSMSFEGQDGDVSYIDYLVEKNDPRHILVIAYCNVYGSIKEELDIGDSFGRFTSDEYQRGYAGPGFRTRPPRKDTSPRDIRAPSTMGSHDLDPGFGDERGLYDAQPMEPGFEFDMNEDYYE